VLAQDKTTKPEKKGQF
jgi:hypothetical protein